MSFRVVKTRHQVRVPESATLTAEGVAADDAREVTAAKAAALLSAAEEEARRLRERADADAARIRREAFEEGFQAGRDEGLRAAGDEARTALKAYLAALDQVLETVRQAHDLAELARERAVREVAREMAASVVEAAFARDPDLFSAHVDSVLEELKWDRVEIRLGPGWRSVWARLEASLLAVRGVAAAEIDPALGDREVVLHGGGLTLLLGMESALAAALDDSTHGERDK